MKKFKKILSVMLIAINVLSTLGVSALAAESQGADKFPDVKKTDWFYPTVDRLTKLGAISGMPNGKFYPNNTITRAEFVKIIVGSTLATAVNPNADPYLDINHWAKDTIIKAEGNNLLHSGEYPTNTWDKPILRQEWQKL